jgi:uncharacterized protein
MLAGRLNFQFADPTGAWRICNDQLAPAKHLPEDEHALLEPAREGRLWQTGEGKNAMRTEIPIPTEQLQEFCRRWKIAELRVFGSALREDFRSDSDVDLLVRFAPDADWSLLDRVTMEEELGGIIGRKVDLVSQRAIERSSNWIRRKANLESAESYVASR